MRGQFAFPITLLGCENLVRSVCTTNGPARYYRAELAWPLAAGQAASASPFHGAYPRYRHHPLETKAFIRRTSICLREERVAARPGVTIALLQRERSHTPSG